MRFPFAIAAIAAVALFVFIAFTLASDEQATSSQETPTPCPDRYYRTPGAHIEGRWGEDAQGNVYDVCSDRQAD